MFVKQYTNGFFEMNDWPELPELARGLSMGTVVAEAAISTIATASFRGAELKPPAAAASTATATPSLHPQQ